MNTINEFVNAKSMATPGLAGGLVMFITNAIDYQFGCGPFLPYFVLGFSFLVGFVVFVDQNVGGLTKFAFYLINSMIIFAVASGTNQIGVHAAENLSAPEEEIKATLKPIGFGRPEDSDRVTYLFTQFTPDTLASDGVENKKRLLHSQIVTASENIQLVQTDLVMNQIAYVAPKDKFDRLKQIYAVLDNINRRVKNDSSLSNQAAYQAELLQVQDDLQALQDALLSERKKASESRAFFKPWFKK